MNILKRAGKSLKYRLWIHLENIKYLFTVLVPINKKKIYIFNTPVHNNIGDSAIAYAEILFLNKHFKDKYKIIEVTNQELNRFRNLFRKLVKKNDIVMLHGGGNMGIEWFIEEQERRNIIKMFPNNKIISWPQTIFYGESKQGKIEFENSKFIYNQHKDLTFIAREEVSYRIMKQAYNKCNVILTPDIVLSMNELKNNYRRKNITFCFRKDSEKILKNKDKDIMIAECKKISDSIVFTDMISETQVTKENRIEIIKDKFKDFQKSKLVITDRLHGMVFCAISGTPCITFGNYNQKVKGTYEWIKNLNYIKYVDNVDDAKNYVNQLINLEQTKYDNSGFINKYDQIKNIINDTFRGDCNNAKDIYNSSSL